MTTAFFTDSRFSIHTLPGHPEHAGRLEAIVERLETEGMLSRFQRIEGREATRDEILRVHAEDHVRLLERTAFLEEPAMYGADTYIVPESYQLARLASGGLLSVVDSVMENRADNGLAAIRPPGHHARPKQAMGFCLINNIAIAARYTQFKHNVQRVAIVDFDVHHGNGTQDIFYDDPSVLFISSHQSPLYPGTGHLNETGRGEGRGANINLPVPPATGDSAFRTLTEQIIIPVLNRFKPELLLVSTGFDAHWRDPLANLEVSLTAFAELSQHLITIAKDLCDGKIIFVTEGGYDLEVLSYGVLNVALALLGDETIHDPLDKSNYERPLDETLLSRLLSTHHLT